MVWIIQRERDCDTHLIVFNPYRKGLWGRRRRALYGITKNMYSGIFLECVYE